MQVGKGGPDGVFGATQDAGEEGGGRKKPSTLQLALVGIVVILVAWKMLPSGEPPSSKASAPAPSSVAPSISSGTLSQSAVDTQRQVEIDAMKDRISKQDEMLRSLPQQFDERLSRVENKLNKDIQELVGAIEGQSEARVRSQRAGSPGGGAPLPGGFVDVPLPADGGAFAAQDVGDDRFPYRRLGGGSAPGGGLGLPSLASAPPPATPQTPTTQGLPPIEPADAGSVAEPAPVSLGLSDAAPANTAKITLPAYSYVDLRTLHGVTCPIRTGATSGLGLTSAVAPITLPIVGPFRGPQGIEMQTGQMHVFGFCEGADRRRPTGMIKIEGLSMVMPDGSNHHIKINGYVIDGRDNDLGVRGRKESVKGEQLALSMLSSGIAGAGEVFSRSAFDQVETQGGNLREILQGDQIGDALIGAAVASPARDAARFFKEYADSLFDVVAIDGGVPVKLIIEEPITLPMPGDAANETSSARPLL